jgi:phage tail sheath protein FI
MTQAAGSGASRVIIEEEEPRIRAIPGVPTAIFGAVGVAERGPIGVATALTSFEDFDRIFGRDTANADLPHIARGFFEEGGQLMYAVRTVHYTNPASAATKTSAAATLDVNTGATAPTAGTVLGANVGPFDLEPGDTLVVDIDAGGPATATFSATAASRDSGSGPFALSNGQTLTVSVNGGAVQTIAFLTSEFVAIGAATRAEVAAVINAKIAGASASDTGSAVRLTSDRRGTGSGINVTGGTANGALGFTTGNTAGGGNVSNVDAVTVAEVKTIVEAAVAGCTVSDVGGAVRVTSNTTGVSSSVLVQASSTADDELGLDNATHTGSTGAAVATLRFDGRYDGAYANRLTFRVSDASSGVASEFDLQVLDDGRVVQTFPNLTMDETADRYVETVVNDSVIGSPIVIATDLAISGSATDRRPANQTTGVMAGGNDGLSGIVDADYIGSSVSKTGLYALDAVSDLRILSTSGRATAAVHNAGITYCEVWRNGSVFYVLDCPSGLSAVQIVDYVETTAGLLESSEFGAIYWPRVKVLNPNRGVFGNDEQIVVPHSGIVAGVYARTDASQQGGVYQPPAGVERGILRSVLGFETDETLDERKRDLVYPKRINPLTTDRGLPRYIDGTRTLKSGGNFPTVAERRGVIFIEQSIKVGLQFARHSNNTPALRRRAERSVEKFLGDQMRVGAFRSDDPATAFFVDFGDGLNTDPVVFAGQMIGRIGLATNKPNDWVVLRFSQDTRALEAALNG